MCVFFGISSDKAADLESIVVRVLLPIYFLFSPLIVLLWWLIWRKYQEITLVLQRIYTAEYIKHTRLKVLFRVKMIFIFVAYIFLLLGLSHPEIERNKATEGVKDSIHMVFFLDLSKSMYVQENGKSRIERVLDYFRFVMQQYRTEQVHYSVLGFTDNVVQLVPFTDDRDYVKSIFSTISSNMILDGSSDITKVLSQFRTMSRSNVIGKQYSQKTLLLFASDGEYHESFSSNVFSPLIQDGFSLFFVSSGTETGGNVPNMRGGYMYDNGAIAISHAKPNVIRSFAQNTQSPFVNIQTERMNNAIDRLTSYNFNREWYNVSWIGYLLAGLSLWGYIITILI